MKSYSRLAMAAVIAGFTLPAFAAGQAALLPQAKTQGSITFVSGGIGSDEAAAMRKAEKQYPLSMTFSAGKQGEFLAHIGVTIKSKGGSTVLHTVSDGPIMLVKLPAGDYRVAAEVHGKTLEREAKVAAAGDTHLSFHWPKA